MTIQSDNFFAAFDYLIDNYGEHISTMDISKDLIVNLQDMIEIVEGLKRGKKSIQ